MSRRRIAAGLIAGVAIAGTAWGKPAQSSSASARAARRSGAAKATATNPSSKSPNGSRVPARDAGRGRAANAVTKGARHSENLPRGFTWPPSRTMLAAAADCERALDAASVAWHPASRDGHIVDAVTIDDAMLGGVAYTPVFGKGPHKLDCQLALALARIGPELQAAGVREVRFGSIYRWSNVRVGGKTKNVLSRHALGLAMDVVAFVDGAGRAANVARDYRSGDPLLLDVERTIDASRGFRLVLTPKNDPISHSDHFHIEANPSYAGPSQAARVPRS